MTRCSARWKKLLGRDVVRPNIAGLMGAYGMALITKDRCPETHRSTLVTPEELEKITMKTDVHRCPGCGNHCLVTVTTFSDGRAFVSGNRCERGASLALTGKASARSSLPNIYQWKYDRLFSYRPLSPGKAPRGTVGIPAPSICMRNILSGSPSSRNWASASSSPVRTSARSPSRRWKRSRPTRNAIR